MATVDLNSLIDRSGVTGGNTTINRTDINTPLVDIKDILNDVLNGGQEWGERASDPSNPPSGTWIPYFKSDGLYFISSGGAVVGPLVGAASLPQTPSLADGRLTLSSTDPAPDNPPNSQTLYYLPYKGNQVSLFSGSRWSQHTIPDAGVSAAVPNTTSTNYDVFLYDNSGTLTLSFEVWTNDTTRNVPIVRQSGTWVKNGASNFRYLGTVRTISTLSGYLGDNETWRFVWNVSNRVTRRMLKVDTTNSWSYTTNTWRAFNNSNDNRIQFVMGLVEDHIYARFSAMIQCVSATTGNHAGIGINLDSTSGANLASVNTGVGWNSTNNMRGTAYAEYAAQALGYHYLQMMELGNSGTTFYGDFADKMMSGMYAQLMG